MATTDISLPGGRTAWSCIANVAGFEVQARFWYDGQYVNNAREDAAQVALQKLNVLPSPPTPFAATQRQPPHQQNHGQHFYGAING